MRAFFVLLSGAVVGAVLTAIYGPRVIAYWFQSPVTVVDCTPAINWAMGRLSWLQLSLSVVGATAFFLVDRTLLRRKKGPGRGIPPAAPTACPRFGFRRFGCRSSLVINLAYALLAGAVTLLVLAGAVHLGLWASLLPALAVLIGVYYWRTRVVLAKVKVMMDGMQKDLQAGRIDKAVETLKGAFPLASQQFLLSAQLHSALGVLLYGKKDFDAALPHLERAFFRDWQAQTTLGALHYKRNEYAQMEKAFEKAVAAGKNQPLAWSVYAWCLNKANQRDKAQQVLTRAIEANPGDERLKSNLTALQNDKRMKMQAYEPEWFQFHLERLPAELGGGRRVMWQQRR